MACRARRTVACAVGRTRFRPSAGTLRTDAGSAAGSACRARTGARAASTASVTARFSSPYGVKLRGRHALGHHERVAVAAVEPGGDGDGRSRTAHAHAPTVPQSSLRSVSDEVRIVGEAFHFCAAELSHTVRTDLLAPCSHRSGATAFGSVGARQ